MQLADQSTVAPSLTLTFIIILQIDFWPYDETGFMVSQAGNTYLFHAGNMCAKFQLCKKNQWMIPQSGDLGNQCESSYFMPNNKSIPRGPLTVKLLCHREVLDAKCNRFFKTVTH